MDRIALHEFESEETYKDLFDHAHDLIHIVSIDGTLIYVNHSWMNLLEYELEEIVGRSIYTFLIESDRERFLNYRNLLIYKQEKADQISITLVTKSGKKLIVEGFVSVKIKDGKPIYTRGIFRDITSKVKNEIALQASNEELKEREYNLQQLLLYAPDAIIVIDAESRIIFWNPKAEDIFGWKREEVTGSSLTDKIIPPEFRSAHSEGMKRFLSTGVAHVLNKTIDITALNKKGDTFYISLTISTARQGGKTCFIAFIRDITQQKLNELELDRKRKELEISNKELEQFAHVASHDMKEPIRKIKIFGSRLGSEQDQGLSEESKLYLSKIMDAADRLNSMVEGVLNYSTVNNNNGSLSIINIEEIMRSIQYDLELLINEKNAQIEVRSCYPFQGIQFLIYQLFYNLLNNSLKFTREGIDPQIEINCRIMNDAELSEMDLKGDHVEITFSDNGIGFDQIYSERIFTTFTRLHSKDAYDGTGLGLTLCKNIVERHHGMITAEGKHNEGASFRIILPKYQPVDNIVKVD